MKNHSSNPGSRTILLVAMLLGLAGTAQPADRPTLQLSKSTVKLAKIAYETGSKVTWSTATAHIEGNPAATNLLKRDYRPSWEHSYQS